jgi:hypothetical protein
VIALALGFAAAPVPAAGNRLAGEPSPYLALHASDPVDWQPWGPEVLERARREGKLILVSSGYFACHWCHVMQRESFQDPEVAAYLNRYFVPVKIDRELLPALDAQLLAFLNRTRGRAGWPLNVVLTPAGHPLFGTVYQRRDEFLELLRRLQERWRRDAKGLSALAEAGARELAGTATPPAALRPGESARLADGLSRAALAAADELAGGFGHESKFPASPQLLALLDLQRLQPRPELGAFLRLTLDQMASLGLRDALGGGFFRYTVDPGWHTPHFEKMLYDNAQLAEVYRRAAEILGEPRYGEVSRDTLDFLLAAMAGPGGGFVASLSALDAEGREGGYYLWSEEALRTVLAPAEREAVALAWDADAQRGGEGLLPMAARGAGEVAARLGIPEGEATARLDAARVKLTAARAGRTLPRDEKVIAGWNGLALEALARAAAGPGGGSYREAAARLASSLATGFGPPERLRRALLDGRPAGEAGIEDYAYGAAGLLAWWEVSGDAAARTAAGKLIEQAWRRFRTPAGWRLAEAGVLPIGDVESLIADGPTPSPSAVLLRVSLRLAEATGDNALRRRATEVAARDYPALTESPLQNATHVLLLRQALGTKARP